MNIFCNNECCAEYNRKQKIKDWQEHPENYSKEDMPEFIRNYLIDKYKGCQLCG